VAQPGYWKSVAKPWEGHRLVHGGTTSASVYSGATSAMGNIAPRSPKPADVTKAVPPLPQPRPSLPPRSEWRSVAKPSYENRDPDIVYFDSPPDPTQPKPRPFRRSDIGPTRTRDKAKNSNVGIDRRKSDIVSRQRNEIRFHETVRNKEARKKLHATDCPCCREVSLISS
jgi:hypothetical protein